MARLDLTPDDVRAILNPEPSPAVDGKSAAVAVVFRSGEHGSELLFIQRASKDSDPWSGHMAFPGGRTDETDRDSHHTAERETREEVGLDLTDAPRLGSLNDLLPGGGRGGLSAVHANAYWLDGARPELTLNYEVADALWVPLAVLADADRFIDYYYPISDSTWPGIQLANPVQVVWGLTLRFLADLYERLDTDFIELAPW